MTKLNFNYDEERDIMTIEGMCYSGDYFRAIAEGGLRIGDAFRILKREDGVVTIEVTQEQRPAPMPADDYSFPS